MNIMFDESQPVRAFDGDIHALSVISAIIMARGCKDFVETGTYRGGTALGMYNAALGVNIWTVEVNPDFIEESQKRLEPTPVKAFFGNSVSMLRNQILPRLQPNPVFYLDSHVSAWNVSQNPALVEHYPLKDELREIAKYRHLEPVIAIHDFANPDHPEYGHDSDHGVPLDMDYIRDEIALIYGASAPHFHNDEATGHRIGIVYIGIGRDEI